MFSYQNKLCVIKNYKQLQCNLIIRGEDYPFPNSIIGFSAHIFTWAEINDIPAVSYIAITTSFNVELDSINIFKPTEVTYAIFRGKTDPNYLSEKNINLKTSVFDQFKSDKSSLYC